MQTLLWVLMQEPLLQHQGLLWDGTGFIFLPGAGLDLCWEQCRDGVVIPGQG